MDKCIFSLENIAKLKATIRILQLDLGYRRVLISLCFIMQYFRENNPDHYLEPTCAFSQNTIKALGYNNYTYCSIRFLAID